MSIIRTGSRIIASAAAIGAAIWGYQYLTAPPYEGGAGIEYGKVYAPVRDATIKYHMWYPTEGGGRAVTVGGNGVFYGTEAGRNAPKSEGQFPLILISHGSGGNAGQFGWIAQVLAEAGYVVILPNHPGTTTGNASGEAAMRLWERPEDLSAIIDAIEADREAFSFIDTSRIASLGFSAGGYTAMALAGVRLSPERLNAFCDQDTGLSDCAFFEIMGIDLHSIDFGPAAQDLRDPRVTASVAIDPGTAPAMVEASFAEISVPVQIISLGAPGEIPLGVNACKAAAAIPNAEHVHIEGAWHFSFLAQCKAKGARILENEGELDRLCDEVSDRSRADIHTELAEQITGYLAENL